MNIGLRGQGEWNGEFLNSEQGHAQTYSEVNIRKKRLNIILIRVQYRKEIFQN
jgi:hypothetical protein